MPVLGLGVYEIQGPAAEQAVRWALEAGYRHIDTASFYKNEREVGHAIKASGISREEIFVTTKLWPTDFLRAESAFMDSLKRLEMDYVDLYLIHWPMPLGKDAAWDHLQKIYARGQAKSIGVSNYSIKHLESLLRKTGIVPAVNQVEFSPFLFQKELLEYCASKHIQLEAYSPLTRGKRIHHPLIVEIAERYKKSPAQILIRWSLQHGLVVIPKSSRQERIVENADVFDFEISRADMDRLNGLNENLHSLFQS